MEKFSVEISSVEGSLVEGFLVEGLLGEGLLGDQFSVGISVAKSRECPTIAFFSMLFAWPNCLEQP